ncbi:extracellular solute-binding protein [Streptosporangium sp. NPDC048047]|uniref:extracellular solute-binding protein n=1 Tax=Streptosporangium sp. NPDC048047 TaxID=3155748 RepID=UPI00342544CE
MKRRIPIEVWVPDLTFPGWMDRWYKQGEDFERAHPEYEVRVHGKDFWRFPRQVAEAAAEGRTPAISEYYFYMTQAARDSLAQDGSPLFTSVQKAIGGRTEILGEPVVIDDIIPPIRDYYTYQGDLDSMPTVATTSLLYANKGLLRRAGVTKLPETWEEVEEVCRAVAATKDGPSHAITWSNHGTFIQQAVASQGGLLVDNHNGRAGRATTSTMGSPEMIAWATWWKKLHRDGHYLYTGKIPDWAGTLRAFAEQDVAIRISSSNDVNYMHRAAEDNDFEMEVGIFPYDDRVPYVGNAIAGTSLWLANGLDEATREGALAFLQYLHNPEYAAERHRANSFLPLTYSAAALLEEEGWFDRHPRHRVAYDHVMRFPAGAVRRRPELAGKVPASEGAIFGDFAGNQDVMTRAMGDILARDADPQERFAFADVEAQRLLDIYNEYAQTSGFRDPENSPTHSLSVEAFSEAAAGRDYSAADMEAVVRLNG